MVPALGQVIRAETARQPAAAMDTAAPLLILCFPNSEELAAVLAITGAV